MGNPRYFFAILSINNKWGYIDKTGKIVIKITFYASWFFFAGLAGIQLAP